MAAMTAALLLTNVLVFGAILAGAVAGKDMQAEQFYTTEGLHGGLGKGKGFGFPFLPFAKPGFGHPFGKRRFGKPGFGHPFSKPGFGHLNAEAREAGVGNP